MDMRNFSEKDLALPTFEPSNIFIGREQQIDLFEMYYNRWKKLIFNNETDNSLVLTSPSPNNKIECFVVLLYGRGGFGKSTLLKRYRDLVLEENQKPLFESRTLVGEIIDWEFEVGNKRYVFNPPKDQDVDAYEYFRIICRELAISLGKKPQDFKEYQSILKDIESMRKKASGVLDQMQKEDQYSWLRGLTIDFVMSTIRSNIPGSGVILDNPNIQLAASSFAKLSQEQIVQIYTKLHNKLGSDFGEYLEAPIQLGLAIGRDLSAFTKNAPLLLFFDTYEEIDEGDSLLRIIMKASGIRVGWIIAGRDNLWAGIEQRKRTIHLEYGYKEIVLSDRGLSIDFNAGGVGAFTISDIIDYFAQIRKLVQYTPPLPTVTKKDASGIAEVTQGVPLAVKLAAGLYVETADLKIVTERAEGKRKIVDEMIARYLFHARDEQSERARLYGLALLRRGNQPFAVAAAIGLTQEQATTSYQSELSRLHRRYSFVFTEKNYPSLHQEVRHFLRLWLLENRNLPEIITVNENLKETYIVALKKLEARNTYKDLHTRINDEEWTGIYLDLTQQMFWLEPAEGVKWALPLMSIASTPR